MIEKLVLGEIWTGDLRIFNQDALTSAPSRQAIGWALDRVMQLSWLLFLWHMPDDAAEGVSEHSSRLQPAFNLHASVTTFMFSWSGTYNLFITTLKEWRLGWSLCSQVFFALFILVVPIVFAPENHRLQSTYDNNLIAKLVVVSLDIVFWVVKVTFWGLCTHYGLIPWIAVYIQKQIIFLKTE